MSDEQLGPDGAVRRRIGAIVCRLLVPAHILVGAAMKFWHAAPEKLPAWIRSMADRFSPAGEEYDTYMSVLRAVLCVELIAAGAMILMPRLSRGLAIAMLSVFAFVLGAEIVKLSGDHGTPWIETAFSADCGCYGNAASIQLGVMLLIDLGLLGLAVAFRPPTRPLADTPKWVWITAGVWVIASIGVGTNPVRRFEHKEDWQILQPGYWVGKPFAETYLAQILDVDPDAFGGGAQTWILVRTTCDVCHHLIETEYLDDVPGRIVVLLEVPLLPQEIAIGEPRDLTCPNCVSVRIPDGIDWSVNTPTVIEIDDAGTITSVRDPSLESAGRTTDDI